jgi:preprotein translocase subunit SecG
MITFLTVLHIIICVFLIIVVLLQAGKGGGMGIAFGGGGSQTVFGSSGAGNFLTRLTSVTAFAFLITSLTLAHYSSQQDSKRLQRLAERKAEEKKVEDARAAKLKEDLDKARQNAKTPAAPNSSEAPSETPIAPAPSLDLGKAGAGGLKLTPPTLPVPGEKTEKAAPAAKAKGKPKTEGDETAKPGAAKPDTTKSDATKAAATTPEKASDGETGKPAKKKRRVAPAEGDTGAIPPPPEAPAPPAQ